jgi:hypothetical protein
LLLWLLEFSLVFFIYLQSSLCHEDWWKIILIFKIKNIF